MLRLIQMAEKKMGGGVEGMARRGNMTQGKNKFG